MAPSPVRAFVGLGANLGDARSTVREALRELAAIPGVELVATSAIYRTAPIDAAGPSFVNVVAELRTTLVPHALLDRLQAIERTHGRERPYRNAPRTLDLDLLLHGETVVDDDRLTLPHPRMHERAFVLVPLADVAPDLVLPGRGPVGALAQTLSGQQVVRLQDEAGD
jgi:2-amino-4-hydroxy-6-hydroxymethyldihydropteridine diphosphokinase